MKQLERDLDLITVILEDVQVMQARIQRFGVTEDSFVNDESEDGALAYDAVMSPVYRIAEDTIHLSDALQEEYPDYPWRDIRGFRNFVAHGYREVDKRIAWKVVQNSIPELAEILRDFSKNHGCSCG